MTSNLVIVDSKCPYTARVLVVLSIRARPCSAISRSDETLTPATSTESQTLSRIVSFTFEAIAPRHHSLFRVFFHLSVFQRLLPSVKAHHPASLENKVFNSLCFVWKHKVRRFPLVEGKGHDPGWKRLKRSQGPWALWECFSTLDPALWITET